MALGHPKNNRLQTGNLHLHLLQTNLTGKGLAGVFGEWV